MMLAFNIMIFILNLINCRLFLTNYVICFNKFFFHCLSLKVLFFDFLHKDMSLLRVILLTLDDLVT